MWRSSILNLDSLNNYRKTQSQIQMPLLQRQQASEGTYSYSKQIIKIGDQLDIRLKYKQSYFHKFSNFMQSHLPPIHPDSLILLIWNVIALFCVFYNFIVIPIGILIINFYSDGSYEQVLVYIDIAMLVVFIIDMLFVRSRICYYQKQKLVTSYQLIYKKYLKSHFVLDLLTIVGYILYVIIPTIVYLKLFLLLKVYAYFDLNERILHKLVVYPYTNAIYKFLRLVAFVIIITNLAGCIYFAIDYGFYRQQGYYYENGMLWLTSSSTTFNQDLIIYFDWPEWYEYAMYFSVQTIAGCGYGNITPRNSPQVLYCNILIITFFVMYTVFRSEVYAIFTELDIKTDKKQEKMRDYRTYINQNQVQKLYKKNSKFYIQSYLRRSHEDQIQEDIYSYLSDNLKVQMKLAYNTQIYSNLPIMKTIFRQSESWTGFAKSVIQSMKITYFASGDILSKSYSTENFKLIVIIRGRAKSTNFSIQNYKVYKQWDYIGQREFFFKGINTSQIRCLTFTKFCYLDRKQFFNIIRNHQQQNEVLKQAIQGVYINDKQGKQFGLCCNLCEKPHIQHFCEICNKWKNRMHKFGYKIESKQRQRQRYSRSYAKSKKIRNLSECRRLQVDQYKKSIRYHVIYNIKELK